MNIVIANKFREAIKNLGIEISGVLEGEFTSNQILNAFSNYYYERIILDVTAIKGYQDFTVLIEELKKIFTILEPSKSIVLIEDIPQLNNEMVISNIVNSKIYNFAFNIDEIIELYNNPRTYDQVMEYSNMSTSLQNETSRIIGVKNVTEGAGATTLIYMMMLELSKKYTVKCLEIGKNDFKHFQSEDMISVDASNLISEVLKEPHPDVILIDQNDFDNEMLIKETLYLLEPSIVKLNKKVEEDSTILNKLKDKKIVLNRTALPLTKLEQFEQETGLKVFDIIRNIDERNKVNTQVMNLLTKLGFDKINGGKIINDDTEKKKSIF